jgi:hypothetical protein
MQNICKLELLHSKRGREDGKGMGRARCLMNYGFPSLPIPWLAGHQVCILTVNEARIYLAPSVISEFY